MLGIGSVLGESLRVYRLLWRRSLVAAALVYAVIDGALAVELHARVGAQEIAASFLYLVLSTVGPVLVQAALVVPVESLHAGERPRGMVASVRRAGRRLKSLVAVVIVYTLGVFFGLLALIVPGVLAAARWSLMIPSVVVDELSSEDARNRSRQLVTPHTGRVALIVLILTAITQVPHWIASYALQGIAPNLAFSFAWSTLTAPFYAHALTVMYYRLADPERPVIDEKVRGWRSAWAGAR
jgi:hypothetical protein